MTRCATCGALLGSDAEWCGQCYAPVRSPQPEAPEAPIHPDPLDRDLEVSPNGASAPAPPPPSALAPPPRPALAAAAAEAAIPPDIQITLASGSRGRTPPMSDRARAWATALIVTGALGTDVLFFPHVAYMFWYAVFMSLPCGLAIHRLWRRRSVQA